MIGKRRFLALLLALLLLSVGAVPAGAGEEPAPNYRYRLYLTDYENKGTEEDPDWSMTLELYVYHYNSAGTLIGGAFGLRFPTRLDGRVTFTPAQKVSLFPLKGGDSTETELFEPGKHFFLWNFGGDAAIIGQRDGKTMSVLGESVQTDKREGGRGFQVGAYTIRIGGEFPARTSVGLLNWLNTALSQTSLYKDTQGGAGERPLNDEIWLDTQGGGSYCYQGFCQGTDYSMVQTDIGFQFTPPEVWPNAFSVLSYDPKKRMELKLYRRTESGKELVADTFQVPRWEKDVTTADAGTLYAAGEKNRATGTGAYYAGIDLDQLSLSTSPDTPVALIPGEVYDLEVSKESHLTQTLELTATDTALSTAKGFPEDSAPLVLPCGDVNPVLAGENTAFGDGRIGMEDRAALMSYLGGTPEGSLLNKVALRYYADLDGDGQVTLADLAVLMSSVNYGRREK